MNIGELETADGVSLADVVLPLWAVPANGLEPVKVDTIKVALRTDGHLEAWGDIAGPSQFPTLFQSRLAALEAIRKRLLAFLDNTIEQERQGLNEMDEATLAALRRGLVRADTGRACPALERDRAPGTDPEKFDEMTGPMDDEFTGLHGGIGPIGGAS